METLKEYLEFYSPFGINEKETVARYIQDKNLEGEYYPVLLSLIESQRKKMATKLSDIKEIVLYYNRCGAGTVHHKDYTIEENQMMDRWINAFAILGELPEKLVNEVKLKAPNMPRPSCCYIGLIDYIEGTLKINFKNSVDKQ